MATEHSVGRHHSTDEEILKLRKVFMEQPELSIDNLAERFTMSPSKVASITAGLVRPARPRLSAPRKKVRRFPFRRW